MPTCTFFGHRDCPEEIQPLLKSAIETFITEKGVRSFLVGDKGNFDQMVYRTLTEIEKQNTISFRVVLVYFPSKREHIHSARHFLPDGFETVPPRFAIDYRNRYMLKKADFVITYITHNFGTGAAKYAALAKKQHKTVINLAE